MSRSKGDIPNVGSIPAQNDIMGVLARGRAGGFISLCTDNALAQFNSGYSYVREEMMVPVLPSVADLESSTLIRCESCTLCWFDSNCSDFCLI